MKTSTRAILIVTTLSILPIATTNAQQGGVLAIDEVVVTARKRAESLQEVPIAITAFTEQTINCIHGTDDRTSRHRTTCGLHIADAQRHDCRYG
jgi:iron complex outermembrane receptor protein